MKIAINISDEIYKRCQNYSLQCGQAEILEAAVAQGTPLPKGHWIEDTDTWIDIFPAVHGYRCSECNALNIYDDNYCPNCGANMEEEE